MPPKQEIEPPGPLNLLRPLMLMAMAASHIIPTIIGLILSLNLRPLLSFSDFKDEWFAHFWAQMGPLSREGAEPKVMPLLQNNARGVCMEIGPGSGQWLSLYAKANNPDITKIYGVEPNAALHAELRANAVKAGLGDIYEIIGCGAQDVGTKGGIQPASIDTIITVQCLCSIPSPEKIIKELYPLLKPGGRWLVYEHVTTKYKGQFVDWWQRTLNHVWPHFVGGCEITRPSDEWLLQAGEWDEVKLGPLPGEGPYDVLPHAIGTLTKKQFEPLQT